MISLVLFVIMAFSMATTEGYGAGKQIIREYLPFFYIFINIFPVISSYHLDT